MDEIKASNYEHLQFEPQYLQLYLDILSTNKISYKVLTHILANNFTTGITKNQLEKKIVIKSSKKVNNRFVPSEINMSRKMCDDIINFLLGTTLIYHKKREEGNKKEVPYFLTSRGIQICEQLIEQNIIEI